MHQRLKAHMIKNPFMCGFQNDLSDNTCAQGFDPTRRTDTPSIAGLQPRELKLGARCNQIIAMIQ